MGDFDLRVPELGESLRRPRGPHLLEPEDLQLDVPALERPSSPPNPTDIVRAHSGTVEDEGGEHEGEGHGGEGHGEGHGHGPHVHIEGGVSGGRHPALHLGAGVETPNFEAEVEGAIAPGEHVTGDVGAEARIGPEDGLHGTVGVEAEHLGSDHPVVLGAAGIGLGNVGSMELRGGAELGEHPSGRLGYGFQLGGEDNHLRLDADVEGIGAHPEGSVDIGGRARLDPRLVIHGHGGVEGIGGEHLGGNVGGGVELDLNERLRLNLGVDARHLGTPDADVVPTIGIRGTF